MKLTLPNPTFRSSFSDLKIKVSLAFFLFFVFLNASAAPQDDSKEDTKQNRVTASLSVLANQSVDTEKLSLNEIRAIFSLRARQWPNGEPITVLVYHDDSSTHREFSLDKLKMLPHQLRRQWNRYIYSGTGIGPLTVTSKQEMLDTLSRTRGAIGYTYTGVPHENVRTISVD